MNHLLRSHAPISDSGWERLDEEARQRLTPQLAARKLVDFHGPHGWEYSATNLGRTVPARERDARRRGIGAATTRARRSSNCGSTSRSTAASFAPPIAAPTTPTSRRSTRPYRASPTRRTSPCFTAGRER